MVTATRRQALPLAAIALLAAFTAGGAQDPPPAADKACHPFHEDGWAEVLVTVPRQGAATAAATPTRCGRLRIELASRPEMDRTLGTVRVRLSVLNGSPSQLRAPARVYPRAENFRVETWTRGPGIMPPDLRLRWDAATMQRDSVPSDDWVDQEASRACEPPAGETAAGRGDIAPGVRCGPVALALQVGADVRSFRFTVFARAYRRMADVPARPPGTLPAALLGDVSTVRDPLFTNVRLARDLVSVVFPAAAPREARQRAVELIAGTVVGGRPGADGDDTYYVSVPAGGRVDPLYEAVRLLREFGGVRRASVVLRSDSAFLRRRLAATVPAKTPSDDIFDDSTLRTSGHSRYVSGLFVRNIVAVDFTPESTQRERQEAVDLVGGRVVGGSRLGGDANDTAGDNGTYMVRLGGDDSTGEGVARAAALLESLPQIELAAAEYLMTIGGGTPTPANVDSGVPPDIAAFLRRQALPGRQRPTFLVTVPERQLAIFDVIYAEGGGDVPPHRLGLKLGGKIGWVADSTLPGHFDVEASDRYLFTDDFFQRLHDPRHWTDWHDFLALLLRDPDTPDEFVTRVIRGLAVRTDERAARMVLDAPRVRARRRLVELLIALPDSAGVPRYAGVREAARRWLPDFAAEIAADPATTAEMLRLAVLTMLADPARFSGDIPRRFADPRVQRDRGLMEAMAFVDHPALRDVRFEARKRLIADAATTTETLLRLAGPLGDGGSRIVPLLMRRARATGNTAPLAVLVQDDWHTLREEAPELRQAAWEALRRQPNATTGELLVALGRSPSDVVATSVAAAILDHPRAGRDPRAVVELASHPLNSRSGDWLEVRAMRRRIVTRLERVARDSTTPRPLLLTLAGQRVHGYRLPFRLGEWLAANPAARRDSQIVALLRERKPNGFWGDPRTLPACAAPSGADTTGWRSYEAMPLFSFRAPAESRELRRSLDDPYSPQTLTWSVGATQRRTMELAWNVVGTGLTGFPPPGAVPDCRATIGGRTAVVRVLGAPPTARRGYSRVGAYWPDEEVQVDLYSSERDEPELLKAVLWSVRIAPDERRPPAAP